MVSVLAPSAVIWSVIDRFAPVPAEIRMMTAATPMRMPDIVSTDRSLFASTPRTAKTALSRTFTGGPPASPVPLRSATIRPSRIRSTRWACAATSSSWVITTTVRPAALSASKRASTSSVLWLSSAPVGSSASSSTGSVTIARAMATRCCWPPDSCDGRWCSRSASPTRSSAARARRRRSADRTPAYASGSSTLLSAVVRGMRLNDWKMNPILRLRMVAWRRSSSRRTSTPSSR